MSHQTILQPYYVGCFQTPTCLFCLCEITFTQIVLLLIKEHHSAVLIKLEQPRFWFQVKTLSTMSTAFIITLFVSTSASGRYNGDGERTKADRSAYIAARSRCTVDSDISQPPFIVADNGWRVCKVVKVLMSPIKSISIYDVGPLSGCFTGCHLSRNRLMVKIYAARSRPVRLAICIRLSVLREARCPSAAQRQLP